MFHHCGQFNPTCMFLATSLLADGFPPVPSCEESAEMTQFNEIAAAKLSPTRAAELGRVLDLQAHWENLCAAGIDSTVQLQSIQKAFETYRLSRVEYGSGDHREITPEMSPTKPSRLGAWCRTVRAVYRQAGDGGLSPSHVLAKLHRLADQIAARVKSEPVDRGSPNDMAGTIRQFDLVIEWCSAIDKSSQTNEDNAFEIGMPSNEPSR